MDKPVIVEEVEKSGWPSYANEVVAVLLAAPAVAAFVFPEHVTQGFEVLAGAPTWYLTSLGVVVAAILGVKSLGPFMRRGG